MQHSPPAGLWPARPPSSCPPTDRQGHETLGSLLVSARFDVPDVYLPTAPLAVRLAIALEA